MKLIGRLTDEKNKRALALALALVVGFAGGFASRDLFDGKNSAAASEAATVPVEKVKDAPLKSNRLIGPHLWDVYIDPFFDPIPWSVKALPPVPLVPLVPFPAETPKVQTIDGEKELRIVAQVPGLGDKDVKVEAGEHTITIKGHKKQEEKNNDKFASFDESFEQSVHLPCKVNADKVQATVKDGILTVTLPKS
ncbi:MAG: Hsp20/alpha crystallin family protein [Cyanobacteria bacterium REEB67]|nr:Hsp20/alpha crystallin family protein [Cyanobacteria bacterium REEB67]